MDKLNMLYNIWLSLQPLSARKQYLLSQRFSVDYNFNSNHIEGNTLTYGQTELLLLFGKVVGEGDLKDFVDMKASQVGVKIMTEEAHLKDHPLTQNFIRQLKTRPNSVITRYGDRFEYASPEETPALMTTLVDWYNEAEKSGQYSPLELAALFHYRYIRIHPFEDGNGRIARLLVDYILARHDWPMVVVRSRNKLQYLEALHQSDVEIGPSPSDGANAGLKQIRHFMKYFKKIVEDELKYDIEFVSETSPNVWWYDGQKIIFRAATTPKLLQAMQYNPDITIEGLASHTGISIAAVNKQLRQLLMKGYIQRSESNGSWRVFASTSI